jgi:hypothetical protein
MTIAALYKSTYKYYQKQPEDEVAKSWVATLSGYGISEVEQALEQHKADYRIDDLGRTKGSYMPYASDLAAIIHKNRRDSAQSDKLQPCGKCEEGWIRAFHGQTIGNSEGLKAQVDEKVGAVKACDCRLAWLNARRKVA